MCQGGVGGDGFETTAIAAATRFAVELDGDVAQFAGEAAVAFEDLAVVDDAETEAIADIEHGEMGDPFGGAIEHLGPAKGVALLDDGGIEVEQILQIGTELFAVGLMQVGREDG